MVPASPVARHMPSDSLQVSRPIWNSQFIEHIFLSELGVIFNTVMTNSIFILKLNDKVPSI